jgi:hypothetical protein
MAVDNEQVNGLLHKKVAGIPVVYIGVIVAAFAIVFVVRSRKSKTAAPAATDAASAQGDGTSTDQPAFYVPPTNTSVNAANVPGASTTSVGSTGMAVPTTNDQWANEATSWLLGQGFTIDVAGPAIQNFIDGTPEGSTDQVTARDKAVAQFGLPPEGVKYVGIDLGNAGNDVPTPPVNNAPPTNGNGSTAPTPPVAASHPAPTPARYYTVPRNGMTQNEVAAKNGITVKRIEELNGALGHPLQWPARKGERVRVG